MHIVLSVEGKLSADKTNYDLMRTTFPAGTVSGAPKIRAMQIIADLEGTTRGPYGAAQGRGAGGVIFKIPVAADMRRLELLHLDVHCDWVKVSP